LARRSLCGHTRRHMRRLARSTSLHTITPGHGAHRIPMGPLANGEIGPRLVSPVSACRAALSSRSCAIPARFERESGLVSGERAPGVVVEVGPGVGRRGGQAGRRSGRSASPGRVSLAVGPGRSCAQLAGGHTPLQVPLNGETWRLWQREVDDPDRLTTTVRRLRQAQPARVYALPTARHTSTGPDLRQDTS